MDYSRAVIAFIAIIVGIITYSAYKMLRFGSNQFPVNGKVSSHTRLVELTRLTITFSIDDIDNGRLRGLGEINCYSTCTERRQCGHCLEIGSQTRSSYCGYQGGLFRTPEL